MGVVIIQAVGVLVFLAGSIWLGKVVRGGADGTLAENASRISHLLFWGALVLPGAIGLFHPGIGAYDGLLGLRSIPEHPIRLVAGVALLVAGVLLMAASNRFLITRGKGAPAFLLTEHLVGDGPYGRVRNPMSLGFYAACAGIGVTAGSLTVTLAVLLIVMPIHIFNLKYFEERELELRYGDTYLHYKSRVPFLIPGFKRGRH